MKGKYIMAVWILTGAGLLLIIIANVHLVYVSVTSQPSCVDHLKKESPVERTYRAAKPSC